MTASLTPALALAYLHELSLDVHAAVVLDAAGVALAGDGDLVARARRLLGEAREPADGPVRRVVMTGTPAGSLLVARAATGGAIAVLAGPCALLSLLEHDLARVADALAPTA